jgi:very-short-patch-repair endonuclease
MGMMREDSEAVYRALATKAMRQIARDLRQRQTPAEQILWECLRNRRLDKLKFRRQHPLENMAYVVDFLCYGPRLVVELDGAIHRLQAEDDAVRQANIEAFGYRVLRFTNEAIFNDLENVLVAIVAAAKALTRDPLSDAPLKGRGDRYG